MPVLLIAVRVEVAEVRVVGHPYSMVGVAAVLGLHACEFVDVHEVPDASLLFEVELYPCVHVESLVRLGLAVFDALDLGIVLGRCEVEVDAVFVALLEQDFRQGVLLDRRQVVIRVLTPV